MRPEASAPRAGSHGAAAGGGSTRALSTRSGRSAATARFWSSLEEPDVSRWEPADLVLRADDARIDRIAEAFARVIDAKSPFTASHSVRVAEIAVGLGGVLGFDPVVLRDLRRAGLLHDIGKLAISNLILDKPGKLTDDGVRDYQGAPGVLPPDPRARTRLRLDRGSRRRPPRADRRHGLPAAARGRRLGMPVRVLAVADVYEALTADRPYRGPLPVEKALDIVSWEVPGAWIAMRSRRWRRGWGAAPTRWRRACSRSPDPQDLSDGAGSPETRPVARPRGTPRV